MQDRRSHRQAYTILHEMNSRFFQQKLPKFSNATPSSSPTMETFDNAYLDYPQSVPQSAWNPDWSQDSFPQAAASSCLPLSMIYDPSPTCDDEDGHDTEVQAKSDQLSEAPEPLQSPRKASWGSSSHTRKNSSSSKSDRPSTRRKRRNSSIAYDTSASIPTAHQLRSTKQGHKISYAEINVKNDNLKGARTSHNLVEKQYRTRLNGQFSTLLNALPPEVVASEVDGYCRVENGGEKKVSKAEVLVLARKHIENLERTKKSLESDKRMLLDDIQRLKGAWVRMGGDAML